ncbi:MAG: DMT family transporter [Alphaproteobacteria bacterium]
MTASPLFRAILAMTIASAFIAFTTVMAKGLAGGFETETTLHPLQVGFGRFFFAAMLWTAIWYGTRQQFEKVHLPLHGMRVVLGYLTSTSIFWAASLMVLADATAISFLSPVVTLFLAWLFLRERVGWMRILAVGVMVTGAMILLRPGTSAFQPAALIALFAALTGGAESIAIKMLTNRERVLQILFINNLIGVVIATAIALFVWVWPTPFQWAALAFVGFGMAGAQITFTWAMRQVEASVIMPFIYTSLLFAALMDFWLFGDFPDVWAGVGAVVIVSGGILLAWRETVRSKARQEGE